MPFAQLLPSFNAGEFSPYLWDRSEIEKYASACQKLENFILMAYGGVYRRPGTEYLGATKHGDKSCRIIGFNFSTTTRFVLEFGEGYVRFWKDGAQVLKSAVPLEVVTPYEEADLRALQFIQINDVMYFVHPSYPPQKLSRLADDNWTFEEIVPDWPALLDENVSEIKLTPSGTTGAVTITASAPAWVTATAYKKGQFASDSGNIYKALSDHTSAAAFATDLAAGKWELHQQFTADSVGSYYQIGHDRDTASVDYAITANGSSSTISVLGEWEFTTYGTWTANIIIQRSYDGGSTWSTIRGPYVGKGDRNISATGKEEREALLRVTVASYSSASSARALLELRDAREWGFVKITGYSSATSVSADVKDQLAKTTATTFWNEGAWSKIQGYPRTVALHEQRVYYAGTAKRPLSIWGSFVDDFENFRVSTTDDSALFFSLSSQEANPIQWMISQDKLLIGTAGDEWTLGSTESGAPITPSNVRAAKQSSYGSKHLRAMVVNDVILFVQRQGRRVRELVYQYEKDGWVAPDLTMLAEHVTAGEIQEVAFQQQPEAIYWAITGDGQLIGMTYERDQNVVGWHRHTTDGVFESVATIYGAGGPDEVWFSVRRIVNGEFVRYIERFKVDYRVAFEDEDKDGWWYLDCAKRVEDSPADGIITGLDHLEGKTVDILADGAVSPAREVEGGLITLQEPAAVVLCGLPYTSTLQTMKLEMVLRNGTTKGTKKRIATAALGFYKSLGGEYQGNTSSTKWEVIYSRRLSDHMDSSPPTFTGDKQVTIGGGHTRGATVSVRQLQPLPLTILSITPVWNPSSR